jgi:hypothetical protein
MLALIAAWALSGDGFFGGREVDFWGTRRAAPRPAAEAELWADSTAPAPVKRLLDAPTAENARAYLDWQAARLRRLREAVEAVEALGRPPGDAILYFSRPGCRWCVLQDRELEGLPVVRVPEGSPLWDRHGVEATPTLVVRGRALRGFTPRARIERELARE